MKGLRGAYAYFVQKSSNGLEFLARALVRRRKGEIITENNIKYASGKRAVCDYYYTTTQEKKPIFIYIHGGGWVCGTKELRKYYCYEYAERGYFVLNIDYDYAPKMQFPGQFSQIFTAIELLLSQAEKYNLDTSKIVIGGESAGAYFSAYAAAISRKKELYDILNIDFKYKDSFYPVATVLLNGAYDAVWLAKTRFLNMGTFLHSFFGVSSKELRGEFKEQYRYFSPMPFIESDFPPSVIGRGRYDGLDDESMRFTEKLREKNVPYTEFLTKGPAGIHGFCIAVKVKEGARCLWETFDFLQKYNGI